MPETEDYPGPTKEQPERKNDPAIAPAKGATHPTKPGPKAGPERKKQNEKSPSK